MTGLLLSLPGGQSLAGLYLAEVEGYLAEHAVTGEPVSYVDAAKAGLYTAGIGGLANNLPRLRNLVRNRNQVKQLPNNGVVEEAAANQAAKKVESVEASKAGSDFPQLSKNNIQHIKKHTFSGMKEQANFLTDEQLANKLDGKSFFNKNWSNEDVIKYTQEAYNKLRSLGKTGLQSVEVNNEVINVFIKEDGTFDTAYGIYKYGIEDFR